MRSTLILLASVFVSPILAADLSPEWTPLLTDSFDGWEIWTGVPHKSVSIRGVPPSNSDNCQTGTPVGLGDPARIYSIKDIDGQPVLHITGQIYAGLTSLESYENYQLSLEYKWGEMKWPPRKNTVRDSGVLVHCTGEHGAFWEVWKRCLECQVQFGDVGDFYALAGTSAIVSASGTDKEKPIFNPAANDQDVGLGSKFYAARRADNFETDGWNRVDIFAVDDKVIFAVNGHIVMRLFNTKNGSQATGEPLTKGQIQIQSEAAEIFYRNIRIRGIKDIPRGYTVKLD